MQARTRSVCGKIEFERIEEVRNRAHVRRAAPMRIEVIKRVRKGYGHLRCGGIGQKKQDPLLQICEMASSLAVFVNSLCDFRDSPTAFAWHKVGGRVGKHDHQTAMRESS